MKGQSGFCVKSGAEGNKNGEHLRGCHHPEAQGGDVGKYGGWGRCIDSTQQELGVGMNGNQELRKSSRFLSGEC